MSITPEELTKRFDHHPPSTPAVVALHEEARVRCRLLAEFCAEKMTPSREQSTALSKIEEAMFWINAGIARNQ